MPASELMGLFENLRMQQGLAEMDRDIAARVYLERVIDGEPLAQQHIEDYRSKVATVKGFEQRVLQVIDQLKAELSN
ncbi:hypothetical protein [Chromobacterium sp. IIBBL 290-4]|uniref:hypothetical protein n=1 Tax=Chromobacterium sp. IIBBL 290-4 TaxID=2953890 RepID=UPI0020B8A03B|nr:hypothetical protein [Chromobacterium sp. IIBBL 290-4]UTH73589.1 hypothetical protein NKT35_18910 [Chromobacterium sp. IIBBL 290-4]